MRADPSFSKHSQKSVPFLLLRDEINVGFLKQMGMPQARPLHVIIYIREFDV